MQCKICGNAQGNTRYEAREMMRGDRDVFSYFQCAKCGCLQIADFPKDISKYYPKNYYSFTVRPDTPKNIVKKTLLKFRDGYALFYTGIVGRLLYAVFPEPKLRLLSRMHLTPDTSILDVGCGAGQLLYTLREAGMKNVMGVDPYIERDISYANGLRISKKSIHEVEGQWDIVMFNHVFEHLADPLPTLEAVFKLLAPGGTCFIRIPTVSSYAWEQYGVNWVQLDAPRHFLLHSRESMRLLAEQAGLHVTDVVYDSSSFQFWASEQYMKDIPLRDPRSYDSDPSKSIFSRTQIKAFEIWAEELNAQGRGDAAAFFLQKGQ